MRLVVLAVVVLTSLGAPVDARTIRGQVYVDFNRDGLPSFAEPGRPGVVVALGVQTFAVSGPDGRFELDVAADAAGIVWARVPDGFVPGPVWQAITPSSDTVELGLRPLDRPHRGPVTFVAAADTHMHPNQPFLHDLAAVAADATALDPSPAFFTILGDVTQGNTDPEFDLVDAGLADLGIPYVPVPGNHDWYDGGRTWFRRYGPDNYSFDIGHVHFVVWNMMMRQADIEAYLGAELARVSPEMTIVAMTHAPPVPAVLDVLRRLGVDVVLSAHTHTNRAVDHGGLIELTTEPLLMGGLDQMPSGYRVLTLDGGQLSSYHRTVVDAPQLSVVAPAPGQCVSPEAAGLLVAAELDAGTATVTARIDCATPFSLRFAGGWSWRGELPSLSPGMHGLQLDARSPGGAEVSRSIQFEVCDRPRAAPPTGAAWSQLGGAPSHAGAAPSVIAPPLAMVWAAPIGGHAMQGSPVVADGAVIVSATDLGDGNAGGAVALELATGALRWRVATPHQVRGGPAAAGQTVAVAQLEGTVLGLDVRSGAQRWQYELGAGLAPEAASLFASPAADDGELLIGNQRHFAAIDADSGAPSWTADPVPEGTYSQSLSAVAIGDGVVVGAFHRELGGVIAWDRLTGTELWRLRGGRATAINASPVIADGMVYVVNGLTEVFATEAATGTLRWTVKLHAEGFDWGNATVGTPAIADGVLVVPTMYGDLVGLDAATGAELWRTTGVPGPLRTTHYRGAGEAAFESSPVITGDVVWAADTSGRLSARELRSGRELWHTELGAPVLSGLAVAGDWLIVATYDGTVRAFAPAAAPAPALPAPDACAVPEEPAPEGGCCNAGGADALPLAAVVALVLRRRRRTQNVKIVAPQV